MQQASEGADLRKSGQTKSEQSYSLIQSKEKLTCAKHEIEVGTKPGAAADAILEVDGNEVGHDAWSCA